MDNSTATSLEDAIAAVIQREMRKQGISENRMANDIGIPRVTLRNRFAAPGRLSIRELGVIAKRLGTTAEQITAEASEGTAA